MATACKSGHRDKLVAKQLWEDMLNQVGITIAQMQGPSEKEVNENFIAVRQSRGIPTSGNVLARPPSDMMVNTTGLQKVGFK